MTEEVQTQEVAQPAAPQLTLGDLTLALNTIAAVQQRGAIRAEEMSTVGGLYDRLFKFLESQGAIQTAQPQQPAPAETTEEATAE